MAVIDTYALVGPLSKIPPTPDYSGQLGAFAPVDNSPPVQQYERTSDAFVSVSSTLPISEVEETADAWRMPSFLDDYYYRVHVWPGVIELGNLLSTQVRDVEVWSAYFEPQLLSSLSQVGTDGITLTQPQVPPTSFAALEARTYTLNISTNGAPVINALYTFNFPTDHPTLTVTGRRVVVWPFMPQTKHKETLEWSTDVVPSYTSEQRLALRQAPRQFFDYTCYLDKVEFSRAKAIATQWAHRVYGVPVWSELSRAGQLSLGATFIPVDTTAADYRENDVVILWESSEKQAAVEITTVHANGVSLKIPLETEFETAYIAPLRFAMTPEGISFSRAGNEQTVATCRFRVTSNKNLGSAALYPTYRGKSVVTDRTIMVGDITEKVYRSVDTFDNESGVVEVDVTSNKIDHRQVITFSTRSRAERWAARQWIHSRLGRQKSFWVISWNNDLEVVSDFSSASSGFIVNSIDYSLLYSVKDVMILLKDGTKIFKRITGATANEDGTENINFDSAIGTSALASDVEMVSFMSHVRFDTDSVDISHQYNGQVQISIPVMEIPE